MYTSKFIFVLVAVLVILGFVNVGLAGRCWEMKCKKGHEVIIEEFNTKEKAKAAKKRHDRKKHEAESTAIVRPC